MGKIIIRAKPIKLKSDAIIKTSIPGEGEKGENEEGGGGGGSSGGGGGGSGGGKGSLDGGTGGGGMQKKVADINNVRAIVLGPRKRKLFLSSSVTGEISISVLEAGADSDYDIKIVDSDIGVIKDGSVVVNAIADKRLTLNIELSEDYKRALKVVAYEV